MNICFGVNMNVARNNWGKLRVDMKVLNYSFEYIDLDYLVANSRRLNWELTRHSNMDDICNDCVGNETSGRTSIALNFSHQLNPNLVILQ